MTKEALIKKMFDLSVARHKLLNSGDERLAAIAAQYRIEDALNDFKRNTTTYGNETDALEILRMDVEDMREANLKRGLK